MTPAAPPPGTVCVVAGCHALRDVAVSGFIYSRCLDHRREYVRVANSRNRHKRPCARCGMADDHVDLAGVRIDLCDFCRIREEMGLFEPGRL